MLKSKINNYKKINKELKFLLRKEISNILYESIQPFDIIFINLGIDNRIYFQLEFSGMGMADYNIEEIEKLGFRLIEENWEYHNPHTYLFKEILKKPLKEELDE